VDRPQRQLPERAQAAEPPVDVAIERIADDEPPVDIAPTSAFDPSSSQLL
jgi:hypothetical protein